MPSEPPPLVEPPPSRERTALAARLPRGARWAYVALGAIVTGLAAAPALFLCLDEPRRAAAYASAYPGVFLIAAPFLPLAVIALARPTEEVVRGLLVQAPRAPSRRRALLLLCLAFLLVLPAWAAFSERHKAWVGPWEVVPDASFTDVERFAVPPEARDVAFGKEAPWATSTRWPAAFFFLVDTAPLARGGGTGADGSKSPLQVERSRLQQRYRHLFANERLLEGKLKLSRAGFWRYLAVGAVGFVAALLLLEIVLVFAERRSGPLPAPLFRGLAAALLCFVFWALMRRVTAAVDQAVFNDNPVYDHVVPAAAIVAAAFLLVLSGLTHKRREEWISAGAVGGGILTLLGAAVAPDTVVALFADLKTYPACGVFLMLVVVFLMRVADPPAAAAPGQG